MRIAVTYAVALTLLSVATARGEEEPTPDKPTDTKSYSVTRNVEFGEQGDVKLLADVYLPRGDALRPGVLMVHGGAWMAGSKRTMAYHARRLAECGYAAISIDYRLAPKHKFPAQLEDCRMALAWMHENADKYRIDRSRIAGYGYSAGAHLVSLLATMPEYGQPADADATSVDRWRLQAVVAGGTPSDFVWLPENNESMAYFLGGTRKQKPETYRLASPLRHVTADDPPMFFYHGETDLIVPKVNGTRMYEKARAAGIKSDLLLMPKLGHLGAFLSRDTPERAIEFLDAVLKPAK